MPEISAVLLMTRPMDASEAFADGIMAQMGASVRTVISPLIEVVPTGEAPCFDGVAGLVVTSFRAVVFAGPPQKLPVYCVGSRTRQALEAAGWQVALCAQDADHLIEALIREKPPSPLLHIAGLHRRGAIAARLTEAGLATQEAVVYDQKGVDLSAEAKQVLGENKPVIVPLFSPRTAKLFAAQCRAEAPLHVVGISAAALNPLKDVSAESFTTAPRPDAAAMAETVLKTLRRVEAGSAPL